MSGTGMIENADPWVEDGKVYGKADRIVVGNLFLSADPADPETADETLGTTYTAFLYDPNDEPEENISGPIGAVPLEMTRRQAVILRDRLNQLIK